ncbi:hypothetical protein DBR06_SOUSAS24410053, partial [Sousa chinensis]
LKCIHMLISVSGKVSLTGLCRNL